MENKTSCAIVVSILYETIYTEKYSKYIRYSCKCDKSIDQTGNFIAEH